MLWLIKALIIFKTICVKISSREVNEFIYYRINPKNPINQYARKLIVIYCLKFIWLSHVTYTFSSCLWEAISVEKAFIVKRSYIFSCSNADYTFCKNFEPLYKQIFTKVSSYKGVLSFVDKKANKFYSSKWMPQKICSLENNKLALSAF